MDTTRTLPGADLSSLPKARTESTIVDLKLGLYPQERPACRLNDLIEAALAPHIRIIDSRIAGPLSNFDVEAFVDFAFSELLAQAEVELEVPVQTAA